MTVGNRIKQCRARQGLTQKALADRLDCPITAPAQVAEIYGTVEVFDNAGWDHARGGRGPLDQLAARRAITRTFSCRAAALHVVSG